MVTRRQFLHSALAAQLPARPNVVFILTDNHGAWSLGSYGNQDVRTPHIDRLAAEGMQFNRAFAVNAVCSPTRASLLTGLMPSQHGVHTYLAAGEPQIGPNAYSTIHEFPNLPKLLSSAGYTAGLCGKWHLGANLRPQEGFRYWVTKPHGHSQGFYDQEVIEDGRIRNEPGYLTDFWTGHAVRFLEQNHRQPFFLMLAYNGPYGLGTAMKEPIRNRHAAYYAGRAMSSMPQDAPHPWNHNYGSWMKDVGVRRKYAAEISGIDDGVGRVMETLRRLGVLDNTLIVFTADQGMAGGHSGFWGMGDHSRPLTGFDWNTWVPLIYRHPRRIAAGRRSDRLTSSLDLLPTVAEYLGLAAPAGLPGRSLVPLLEGRQAEWDDTVYFEFENVRSVRTPEWKYIERIYQQPNELYDLRKDPGERLNLAGRADLATVQQDLRKKLYAFFDRHADPKWDLWKGGRSKIDLITARFFGIENPYRPASYLPGPGEGKR